MREFYFPWEFDFLYMLQGIHNPVLDKLMVFFSAMGNAGIFWILLGILFTVSKKYRRTGVQMLVSIAITFIIGNLVIKNLVMRARPCQIDTSVLLNVHIPTDYSFPSGHTMNSFTAAVALFCNEKKLGTFALVIASAIAFSRLYNFMHFPTDVLMGIVLGSCVAIVVYYVFQKKNLMGNPSV